MKFEHFLTLFNYGDNEKQCYLVAQMISIKKAISTVW